MITNLPYSTLAVTYLTEILEFAKIKTYTKAKEGNKKQSRFSEIIIMQHNKANFGQIKLTIGVLRGNGEKIQYCITSNRKNDYTTRNKHAIVM
jgi:hypothetical protein